LKLLLAPARGPLRLMSAGFNVVTNAMTKVLGAQVLKDVQTFASAFETLFGGFRERSEQTVSLLRQPHTAFLVVASPQNDALREASYFSERLRTEKMPLAGVVLNRVTTSAVPLSAERSLAAAEQLTDSDEWPLTAALLGLHAERMQQVTGDRKRSDRFRRGHRAVPTVEVPALADDVHDLDGLRQIGDLLAG
ncbi:MAG: ArsA family ATPase, partial [Kribbellaceae bacterium]